MFSSYEVSKDGRKNTLYEKMVRIVHEDRPQQHKMSWGKKDRYQLIGPPVWDWGKPGENRS